MTDLLKQFENSEEITPLRSGHPGGVVSARLYGSSHGLLRIKGRAVQALRDFTWYKVHLLEENGNKKLMVKFSKVEKGAAGKRYQSRSKSSISLGIAQFLAKAKISPPNRGMVFSFIEDKSGLTFDAENKILLLDFGQCTAEQADWRKFGGNIRGQG